MLQTSNHKQTEVCTTVLHAQSSIKIQMEKCFFWPLMYLIIANIQKSSRICSSWILPPNFLVVSLKLEPVFSFFSFDWASANQLTFVHQPVLQNTVTDCRDHLKIIKLVLIGLWQQQACSSLFLYDFDARRVPLREKNFFRLPGGMFCRKGTLEIWFVHWMNSTKNLFKC